jgi:hypothetical protein
MKRQELLKSSEYWVVQIQNDLFGIINEFMVANKLNRSGLAKKFKVTKGYITQVLNGDFDHKISKLVSLALASGKAPILSFVDLEQYIRNDANGIRYVLQTNTRPIQFNTYYTIDSIPRSQNSGDFINQQSHIIPAEAGYGVASVSNP